jgi:hypothetical protein
MLIAVNQIVLCFLVAGGSFSGCTPSEGPTIGQSQFSSQMIISVASPVEARLMAQSPSSGLEGRKMIEADDRIEVLLDHPVTVAEPAKIPLRISMRGLTSIMTNQRRYDASGHNPAAPIESSKQTVPIQISADGSPYITITPLLLGKVELGLTGGFSDGGIFYKRVVLDVAPTQKRPEKLMVGHLGYPAENTPRILKSLRGEEAEDVLNIYATYEGLSVPVRIDPSFVVFRIISGDQGDPIRLNQETGYFTTTHPGQVLVETSFGGRTNLTCVVVEPQLAAGMSYGADKCQKMLPAGKKLGPVE